MKKSVNIYVLIAFFILAMGGMTQPIWGIDKNGTIIALEEEGYSNIEINGFGWWYRCRKIDGWQTRFKAVNDDGYSVTGTACKNWKWGTVIKVD